MVTLASTIEELEIDGFSVVERLGLINALWDTVANDPAANCDPDGDEIDDEILAGITGRI